MRDWAISAILVTVAVPSFAITVMADDVWLCAVAAGVFGFSFTFAFALPLIIADRAAKKRAPPIVRRRRHRSAAEIAALEATNRTRL
jgi:hypothetical protein